MEWADKKLVLESLQRLKWNNDYSHLCSYLKPVQDELESMIFDESKNNAEKELLIFKRNIIKKFIELPDDLINQFEVWN